MDQENVSFIHCLLYSRDGSLFDRLMTSYYKTYQNLEHYVNPIAAKCSDKRLLLSEEELTENVRPYIPKQLWLPMAQATIKYFHANAQRRLPISNIYDHSVIQLPGHFFSIEPFQEKQRFASSYSFNGPLTSVHKFDIGSGEYFIPNLHAKQFKYAIIKKLAVKHGMPRRWELKLSQTNPGFLLNYISSEK